MKPTVFDAFDRWTGQLRDFLLPMNDFIESSLDAEARKGLHGLCRWFKRPEPRLQATRSNDLRPAFRADPAGAAPGAPRPFREGRARLRGRISRSGTPTTYVEVCKQIQAKARSSTRPRSTARSGTSATPSSTAGSARSHRGPAISSTTTGRKSNARRKPGSKGVQFYVDVFQKYKLSSPNTPQSTDEEAVELFIRGRRASCIATSSTAAPCSRRSRGR